MTTEEIERQPSRVVTETGESWMLTVGGYVAKYDRPARSLEDLRSEHTLRPVLPVTDEDAAAVSAVIVAAGRKAVTTIAAAVEQVFHELRERAGGLNASDSYESAHRTLLAGRPGSWESAVLMEVVWFGNDLNLASPSRGTNNSVAARRDRGPSRRVDVEARRAMVDILLGWVDGRDRYTEVAETLAWLVSRKADELGGRDGWKMVADQWLRPGGLAADDFRTCYRLLYSLSEHFDAGLL